MSLENPSKQEDALIGQTLGQYEIRRKLGEGGMASVYLAEQTSIGRTVAIKVLPPHFMHDPTFMQRFEREVKVSADLQHPRVLPVYDYGQIGGRPYIVMAYMAGGTLADRLQQGPMPLDEVVRLIEQIAEGLDHAHRRGVVHRDFKPSNVLLDQQGNAYLADFGIAKISEATVQLTGTGIVGTPAYMAPEMGREGIVTPLVDIYAMGVTLYQMLTGKYPFKGDTPLSVMMAHATKPIPDVREERPDLPPAVAEVVRKAMAKDPGQRFQSATDLARALRAAVEAGTQPAADETAPRWAGEPTYAPPTPPPAAPVTEPQYSAPPPIDEWQTVQEAPPPPRGAAPRPTPPPKPREGGGCRWGLWAAIAGGAVVLAALCAGGFFLLGGPAMFSPVTPTPPPTSTPPPVVPTETPKPMAIVPTPAEEQPRPDVTPGGSDLTGTTSLVIDNQSSATICYVYVSPRESDSWGEDQLGQNTVINSGDSFTLEDIPAGNYDFQALDCDQNVLDEHYGVDLAPPSFTWSVYDLNSTLTMVNHSSYTVCELYISPLFDGVWGINRIGEGEQVAPGQQYTVTIASGTWDLRALACDGNTYWEQYEVSIDVSHEWELID